MELAYDPGFPLLGECPKALKLGSPRDASILMFTAALFTIAKTWECPLLDEWVSEMWYIYAMYAMP